MNAAAPTILVVEDESSIASFVALYLKNAGYTVRTAATGNDALSQAGTGDVDLVVLDGAGGSSDGTYQFDGDTYRSMPDFELRFPLGTGN